MKLTFSISAEHITDDMVERVESRLSHGRGAWDMVDPKEIISASIAMFLECPVRELEFPIVEHSQ